jgi:hypothetical protein
VKAYAASRARKIAIARDAIAVTARSARVARRSPRGGSGSEASSGSTASISPGSEGEDGDAAEDKVRSLKATKRLPLPDGQPTAEEVPALGTFAVRARSGLPSL